MVHNPAFEKRRIHAFSKITNHLQERRGRFLDIGCGMGNGLVAALQAGFDFAVGVDRSLSEFAHDFLGSTFPELCVDYGINPLQTLLIEGDVDNFRFMDNAFECVMMLDVIEHVDNPTKLIECAFRATRRYLLLDTAPLYFSKKGHHLFAYFADTEPWIHLFDGFERELSVRNVDKWSLARYRELNRIKFAEVVQIVKDVGFHINLMHSTGISQAQHDELSKVRNRIVWTGEFDEQDLLSPWIMLVCEKH